MAVTTTYPSLDIFPGSPPFPGSFGSLDVQVFQGPVVLAPYRMEGNLFALNPMGMSVWRIDGVWTQGFAPSAATVAAADRFYRGGYRHEIDDTEVTELTDAGYGDYITTQEVLS